VGNIPVGGKPQEAIAHFFKFVLLYPHLSEIDSTIQQNEQKLASLDGKVQAKTGTGGRNKDYRWTWIRE